MKVITVCYGKQKEFNSVKKAKDFYLDCILNSEGSECSRYVQIYGQLEDGLRWCSDEEDDYNTLKSLEESL